MNPVYEPLGNSRITKTIDHGNSIREYRTNVDCKPIIDYFEYMNKNGLVFNRNMQNQVHDKQIFMHELPNETLFSDLSRPVYKEWNHLCDIAMRQYVEEFPILGNKNFQHTLCKVQKTQPGQGFHQWHYENTPNTPYRILVTMLYLNDGFDGGETEFLYQHSRITPKAGSFVIFPAAWPWTHRGNPPLNGDKYILTAWVEDFPNIPQN